MPRSRSASGTHRHRAQVVYPSGSRRPRSRANGERHARGLLARPLSRRSVFVRCWWRSSASRSSRPPRTSGHRRRVRGVRPGASSSNHEAMLFLNTVLLSRRSHGISLAASAFDRLGPASPSASPSCSSGTCSRSSASWPDARWCSHYSPFHYLRPFAILGGQGDPTDLLVLLTVFAVAVAYGLWRFPRRPGHPCAANCAEPR
jgi:hypothetical protein